MVYHGYKVQDSFVKDGKICFAFTGNGSFIIGEQEKLCYFIKRNNNVKYPSSTDDKALREKKKDGVLKVEKRQATLRKLMKGIDPLKDHIMKEVDYIKGDEEQYYVSITNFVDHTISPDNPRFSRLSHSELVDLCENMTLLLVKLHEAGVIHGDLKTKNFVYQEESGGKIIPALIDFDSSYPINEIPGIEKEAEIDSLPNGMGIGGTDGWRSPETEYYFNFTLDSNDDAPLSFVEYVAINQDEAKNEYDLEINITDKTDVFTLALVIYNLYCGCMPYFDNSGDASSYALALILNCETRLSPRFDFQIGPKQGSSMLSLLNWMLQKNSSSRPSAKEVLSVLKDESRVPDEYVLGSSDINPIQIEFYDSDRPLVLIPTVDDLKKLNVTEFHRALVDKKYVYHLAIGDEVFNYTIKELLEKGILQKAEGTYESWPEHNLTFASKDELYNQGIIEIKNVKDQYGNLKYLIKLRNMMMTRSKDYLISQGYASEAPVQINVDMTAFAEPWSGEYQYNFKEIQTKKITGIKRSTTTDYYLLEFEDGSMTERSEVNLVRTKLLERK